MRTGRPAPIRRSPTSTSCEGRKKRSPGSRAATIKSAPRASLAIWWDSGPAVICERHCRLSTIDKADRNSASSAAARSRNLSRSRLFGSPGPTALIAECIEGCVAATPMTAAEKRCAMSATTASRSAFDRSRRMQAIRIEIVANQLSAAESRARRRSLPTRIGSGAALPLASPMRQIRPQHKGKVVNAKDRCGVRAVRCPPAGGEPGDRVRARRTSPGAPGTRQRFAVAACRLGGIRQSRRSWIFPRPRRPRRKARRRM